MAQPTAVALSASQLGSGYVQFDGFTCLSGEGREGHSESENERFHAFLPNVVPSGSADPPALSRWLDATL